MMPRPTFALSRNKRSDPGLRVCIRMFTWGLTYFAIVSGVGFLLGIVRVGFVEPRIGTRSAELLEMPLMGVAMVVTAIWMVRKTRNRCKPIAYVEIGMVALAQRAAARCGSDFGSSIARYFSFRIRFGP